MDHTLGCPSIPPTLHHPTPPCHGNWPIGTCITAAPRDISQVRFREPGYMHPSRQVRISRSHSCRFRSPGPWRFLVASIVPHPHLLLSGFQDMYQGWLLIPERHHLFEHRCLSVSCSVSTPSTISTSAGSTLPRGYLLASSFAPQPGTTQDRKVLPFTARMYRIFFSRKKCDEGSKDLERVGWRRSRDLPAQAFRILLLLNHATRSSDGRHPPLGAMSGAIA
jgi:hypothetical protein